MRLAFAAIAFSAVVMPAHADECFDMWKGRNQIYADAGYCFKTADAIRTFGNDGCRFDKMRDVPLSETQRNAIARYVRGEQLYECRD